VLGLENEELVEDLKEVPPTLPPDLAAHASPGIAVVKIVIIITASIDFYAKFLKILFSFFS
jgi:hypothetical protein